MIREESYISRSDMLRCALCKDAPCNKACRALKPAQLLRNIWFRNEQNSAYRL